MGLLSAWRLRSLEKRIYRELEPLGLTPTAENPPLDATLDIAIIGAGQCGLSLCAALRKQKLYNVQVFDQAVEGEEGPWATTARMRTLRTVKGIPGPALDFPCLSFRTWYEATGGRWKKLGKIPTGLWAKYLNWYRSVLKIPVQNGWDLQSIHAEDSLLQLTFDDDRVVRARKVVLATGRAGLGGASIPPFMQNLPKSHWFHTGERIDSEIFRGKEILVVGAAASAFDIAAAALENGAEEVTMVMRGKELPTQKPINRLAFWSAFSSLSDEQRVAYYEDALQNRVIVPEESVARVLKWPNFRLLSETSAERTSLEEGRVVLHTNRGSLKADLLLLGTGYQVDVTAEPVLKGFADQILLWRDRVPHLTKPLGAFPYLGTHFEFLEKNQGKAPFLKHIHCFNYGAFLSHGRVAGDIDQLPTGIERLAQGLAIELFLEWDEKYGASANNRGGNLL